MNEHLMEALRRLRKNSTDNSVDRRLVTNVLLQFLTTPRADVKRFEMLSLLATVLSWNDLEREKAGLQKSIQTPGRSGGGRTVSASHSKGKATDLVNSDETEVKQKFHTWFRNTDQLILSKSRSHNAGWSSSSKNPTTLAPRLHLNRQLVRTQTQACQARPDPPRVLLPRNDRRDWLRSRHSLWPAPRTSHPQGLLKTIRSVNILHFFPLRIRTSVARTHMYHYSKSLFAFFA